MTSTPVAAEEIRAWLTEQIAGILGLPQDEVDPDNTFDSFGLASRDAVSLSGDLEDHLNRRLSPTLLYQYPTIRRLAEYLAEPDAKAVSGTKTASAGFQGPRTEEPVAALSDEEAEAALLKKLLELGE